MAFWKGWLPSPGIRGGSFLGWHSDQQRGFSLILQCAKHDARSLSWPDFRPAGAGKRTGIREHLDERAVALRLYGLPLGEESDY